MRKKSEGTKQKAHKVLQNLRAKKKKTKRWARYTYKSTFSTYYQFRKIERLKKMYHIELEARWMKLRKSSRVLCDHRIPRSPGEIS